ncbi:MAG: response regulator [Gammaproteobacteria bacterium]|nr:response regulator [Gammaproteobacteria bacterium]MDH5387032.1 response regulator [Gammaproteobacteria bacterium]
MTDQDLSIIIVDDLQFSRIVVKSALKKAGYTGVRLADSAFEALKMLEEKPADVVLADWMMPEMDGLELTDRIRQNDEEKGIYTSIILFTANEGIEFLVEAFEHGVDDYLRKPPNPHELAARVSAAARISVMQNDILETSRQMEKTIQRLQQSALIDDVTGAGNERMLISELDANLEEASTRNGGICLAMIKLNNLGQIEDDAGTAEKNEILVSMYRRLRRTVRPTDVITRLDNDIFGIVMNHTQIGSFKMNALDRIMAAINQRPFKTENNDHKISGSIGVHYYNGSDKAISSTEMLELTQNNLTKAIAQGDNSIIS